MTVDYGSQEKRVTSINRVRRVQVRQHIHKTILLDVVLVDGVVFFPVLPRRLLTDTTVRTLIVLSLFMCHFA